MDHFPNVPDPSVFTVLRPALSFPSVLQVQFLDLRSRPRGPSQELQAGLDGRVVSKASDLNDPAHLLPAMMLHQLVQHHFQCDTVKRVVVLLAVHIRSIFNERCCPRPSLYSPSLFIFPVPLYSPITSVVIIETDQTISDRESWKSTVESKKSATRAGYSSS